MRGFHLYAVLLGSLMVALTVAYSVFLGLQEQGKIQLILEMEKRARFIPYVDIMREESFSVVSVVFRTAFQRLLEGRTMPVFIKEEALRRGDPDSIAMDFFDSEQTVKLLAGYMYSELKSYTTTMTRGREVELIGGRAALEDAIREGFYIRLMDDAVILVLDSKRLSPGVRESLPKLRVCESGYCRELTVFPEERVEVTIPLRLRLALEKAIDAYRTLRRYRKDITLMAGFCKEECAVCGIFSSGYYTRLVYPPVDEYEYCEGFSMKLETFLDESGYFRATGIEGGGCKNLSVLLEDFNKYLPCSNTRELLLYGYEKVLKEVPVDGNLEIYPGVIRTLPTVYFSYEKVVDLTYLAVSSVLPPDILEMFGIPIKEFRGIWRLPGTYCEKAGFGYCSFPAELIFIYSWTDEDNTYSVTGYPVTYRFMISLGETGLEDELSLMHLEAKRLSEIDNTVTTNYGECINRLESACKPQNLLEYLKPVCGTITANTLEGIWAAALATENNACIVSASVFVGENGACYNIERACERGISIATPKEIGECASERLASCWDTLSEIALEECREQIPATELAGCALMTAFEYSYPLARIVIKKITEYAYERYGSLDTDQILQLAYAKATSDLCWANALVKLYEENRLSGDCLEEVNSLLGSELSPCINPIASCIITSTLKPVEVSSKLCEERSVAKLRSTFHYNIFDPAYLEVGCYAGTE